MCLAGVLAGAGVEYLTGLRLGVSGDSGNRCLRLLRMMAVGVCTAYCLGLPVLFKTTPCLSSVVICTSVPGTNGVSFSLLDDRC